MGMTTSDILWTVGSSVLGALVSFALQAWKDRKKPPQPPSVQIMGDMTGGTVSADQYNVEQSYSSVYHQTITINSPSQSIQPRSRPAKPTNDGPVLVGLSVLAVLLAALYAIYHDVIILVTFIITAVSVGAIIGSFIYLWARKRAIFDAKLLAQLIMLLVLATGCFLSISFLNSPPLFFGSESTSFAKLLNLFQTKHLDAIGEAGLSNIEFLLYQVLGAFLTVATALLITWAVATMVALADVAAGVTSSTWRGRLARTSRKPGGIIAIGLMLVVMAGCFTSGFLFSLLPSSKTDVFPTGPVTSTSRSHTTAPTKSNRPTTSKSSKPSISSIPATSR